MDGNLNLDHVEIGLNLISKHVIDSLHLERVAGGKPVSTFPQPALGPVEIRDSRCGLCVIQAQDGTIRFDGRPVGEDGTALPG